LKDVVLGKLDIDVKQIVKKVLAGERKRLKIMEKEFANL
jgi:hypothetical protein